MFRLPILHIDQVAKDLGITRDWINRRWFTLECPPPCWRDGDHVFFHVGEFDEWAKRRALGSDSTDTEEDLTD